MNLENEENENLINQEPEEISQEEPEEISQEELFLRSETVQVDYSQDFIILENLGYIQISMIGALLFYFVLSLVIKFLKSFF